MSTSPEPAGIAFAAAILAHPRPAHAAIGTPTTAIVAMAEAIGQLHAVAQIAAELLGADEAVLRWSEVPISPDNIVAVDQADDRAAECRAGLTQALAALGYVTFKTEEKIDGNAD
ncbi:hypothetical protein [Xanthobacter autotrophicus]|uniref:hypothetical protein n=1 Tax=Xanthobacter autotrophicus TaxID=280 RepID=UPI00372BDBF3